MQTDIFIRIASPTDREAVEGLLGASYCALFKDGYDENILARALPIITRANPALLSSERFYIAESGNVITGCGGWSIDRPGTGEIENGLGHVRHFAVHPNWLRQGIGKAILARSIGDARRNGVVRLECNASLVAVEFYEALGFRDIGPAVANLGGGSLLPGRLMLLDIRI